MAKKAAGFSKWAMILPLVLLAAFFLSSKVGLACSGPTMPPTPPSIADRVKAATHIFDGNITNNNLSTITVDVRNYFKGSGPAQVVISGFGGGADCHQMAPSGQGIFFTPGNPEDGFKVEEYWSFGNLRGTAVGYNVAEPFSTALTAQLIQATGHQPVLPVEVTAVPTPTLPPTVSPTTAAIVNYTQPLIAVTPAQPDNSLNWLGPAGAGLLLVVLGVAGFFLFRKRHDS